MHDNGFIRSVAALRRKLRGLGAVVEDPAATAAEKANATALKKRLEQRLRQAGAPGGRLDRQGLSPRPVDEGDPEARIAGADRRRVDRPRPRARQSRASRLQEMV